MGQRNNTGLIKIEPEKNAPAVTARYITIRVITVLLAIAAAVLLVIFAVRMIGGALGDGTSEVIATLESALNGDFDSYWSLLPDDRIRLEASENGLFAIDYKTKAKSDFKEYSNALEKTRRSYALEASKQKRLSADELKELNEKLIADGLSERCTQAVSLTLTVTVKVDAEEHQTDMNGFIIGRIDGEWYPLDFDFTDMTN